MKDANLLMFADSERDANMLYAVGLFVPEPFVYCRLKGRPAIVVNDPDLDRARKRAPHCQVISLTRLMARLRTKHVKPSIAQVVRSVLRDRKVDKVVVPPEFPHALARQLRRLHVRVKLVKGTFFPQREIKTAEEVKKISAALMMAEVGLAEAIQVLRCAKVGKDRRLVYHGAPLTSEKVQSTIQIAVFQAGGTASHTIVAGGRQACDPNEPGYGVLKANEPIVLDVGARSKKTGYHGDIARTVVRGRASDGVRRLYDTVARGQDRALEELKPKANGAAIHQRVLEFFCDEGYRTGRRKGRMEGFFHPVGEGLGLELRERPRLAARAEDVIRAGQVVTIAPGLYYAEMGAVRLEDVAMVTDRQPRNLTRFEKVLEL